MTSALIPAGPQSAEFLQVFNRLCVALRDPGDDSGVTQGIYFEALKDLSSRAIEAGAVALMRQRGRRFFPTTAEWREAAELAQDAQLREAVKPARDEPWTHEHANCEDTGWMYGACEGEAYGPCGRVRKHPPHPFVTPCPCRPVNRTFQRHQRFGSGE